MICVTLVQTDINFQIVEYFGVFLLIFYVIVVVSHIGKDTFLLLERIIGRGQVAPLVRAWSHAPRLWV